MIPHIPHHRLTRLGWLVLIPASIAFTLLVAWLVATLLVVLADGLMFLVGAR